MKVYLAGGFYTGWQEKVIKEVPELHFYNPERDSKQGAIADYIIADLDGIDGCDMVFAYLDNYPKYGGLSAEIGYAYATKKPVILVATKDEPDGFLLGLAQCVCITMDAGIARLRKMAKV